jgi:hypothetical protein
MERLQRKRWRVLHLNLRRGAVTEITTGSMSEIEIFSQERVGLLISWMLRGA